MKKLWLIFYFFPVLYVKAQIQKQDAIISGPMLGQIEIRTAVLWLQVSKQIASVELEYWKEGLPGTSHINKYNGPLGAEFNPVHIELGGLEMGCRYNYQFILNHIKSKAAGAFRTKDLWEWRKPAPDFSFLTGSCAYFNDPEYDRPGKPYGGDSIYSGPWPGIQRHLCFGWVIIGIPGRPIY